MTTGKTIALTRQTFVGKVMSLLFNMLSRLVITFLPRSKCLFIAWLQSPSAVILEPCFHCLIRICWLTVTSTYLHIVYGLLWGTTAKLSSCDRDLCSAKLKSSPFGFLPKSLPNSDLEQKCPIELCVMMEMVCRSVLSSKVATGHTWLFSTWNLAGMTYRTEFWIKLNFNSFKNKSK